MHAPDANRTKQTLRMNHKGMTLDDASFWSFWANISVLVLGVLSVVAAALALYFASRVGGLKDAELSNFQTESKTAILKLTLETEQQRERAAKAETTLEEVKQ